MVPAAFIIVACLMIGTSRAEVVREDGVKSIAGVLIYGSQETAEWTFKSAGGEILIADLDAEIYRTKAEHEPAVSADTGGDCGGEEGGGSGEEGGGCGDEGGEEGGCGGEGGPGLFYIEVWSGTERLCRADKPAPPPGWMRDPRMACVLPPTGSPVTYIVVVGLKEHGEESEAGLLYPFLLNVSLRRIAPTGVNLKAAIAQSGAKGF
jgi:hypothetical protein